MKLRLLKLQGFKSFARKTDLYFDRGITAIIGPNGSGKSNIAEAIRWVLGEQSLKSLRGRSSEDVIFSGSDAHRRSGEAEVSLTLTNESGRLPVEAAEAAVARRVDRSGQADYLLNGDLVRLFDIQHLLAEAGLGAKSYAVVSQGMVDQYLLASPRGRRELFDEATGVKALQLKLSRAEKRLNQAELKLAELLTVRRELEPRLKVLRRQAQRQEERQQVTQQFMTLGARWYHQAWQEQSGGIVRLDAWLEAANETAMAARAVRERLEKQIFLTAENRQSNGGGQQPDKLRLELEEAEAGRIQRQREELTILLEQVRTALTAAREELKRTREAAQHKSLFSDLKHLLKRVKTALHAWQQGQAPSTGEIKELSAAIDTAEWQLQQEDAAAEAAHNVMERLEGPLKNVARLEAIEQERKRQLKALPPVTPPNQSKLEEMRQHQKEQLDKSGQPLWQKLEAELKKSRDEELKAERGASAAAAAADQARSELQELEREIRRERGSDFLAGVQTGTLAENDSPVSRREIDVLAGRLAALGEADELALKEYAEASDRDAELAFEEHDAQAALCNAKELRTALKREIDERFRSRLLKIQAAFSENFRRLFDGGSAHLAIMEQAPEQAGQTGDEERDGVPGIEIMAHPPGKKPQHIGLLSGGEKALTSLALLLAIIQVQRPPFVVLDEVDAALDEANSSRFSELLKVFSATTQCIVITHNRETMGQANVLYGITMSRDGISQAYSVKLEDVKEMEEISV